MTIKADIQQSTRTAEYRQHKAEIQQNTGAADMTIKAEIQQSTGAAEYRRHKAEIQQSTRAADMIIQSGDTTKYRSRRYDNTRRRYNKVPEPPI